MDKRTYMHRETLGQILCDKYNNNDYEIQGDKDELWARVADYILNNFVAKSDVDRDYVYMGGTHNPCAKQEPQTKVYAIASDFERLKELEKSGKPQDSKPRECERVVEASPISPPSICQHEWVNNLVGGQGNETRCLKCHMLWEDKYKPKPTLPDVPGKLPLSHFNDLPVNAIYDRLNWLIDCYSALKKVVEEKL